MTSADTHKSTTSSGRSELRALVSLLDDPDQFVQQKVEERLSQLGESHVPLLDEIRRETSDTAIRQRLSEMIHDITFPSLEQEFAEFAEKGIRSNEDLEQGQLLLSRFDNPTLRTDLYRRQLDRMASRLEPEVRSEFSPSDQVRSFVSFFFDKEYFKGAKKDYANPDNSFLHKVLQRRRGIPISLSMVMLFIARRIDFPLYGVNMPMHFLVKYEYGNDSTMLDPFNSGRVITLDQCSYFLRNNGITPESAHFEKASDWSIMARTLRNLIISYEELGEGKRMIRLKRLLGYVMQART
ncbi:transglutaminase-like domain-containing protein [Balneolales bacterium ANBcel1]|nr:transglutaminase-like domain-containing protein [Balneolales bacterium ANBcel1]